MVVLYYFLEPTSYRFFPEDAAQFSRHEYSFYSMYEERGLRKISMIKWFEPEGNPRLWIWRYTTRSRRRSKFSMREHSV